MIQQENFIMHGNTVVIVELIKECCSQHLGVGRTRMKLDVEIEHDNENENRTRIIEGAK